MSDESGVRGAVVMAPSCKDEEPHHSSPFTPAAGVPYLSTPRPPADADAADARSIDVESIDVESIDETDALDDVEATVDRTAHLTDPRFPVPPERASLDDDDLVPLVARHTDDTATIDLIAVLQAQLQLRAVEAASFAAWENRMRRIGTDEALDEIEKTRLHFTDVIAVQGPAPVITVQHIAAAPLTRPVADEPLVGVDGADDRSADDDRGQDAPLVSAASVPSAAMPASTSGLPSSPIDSARRDAELLEHDPEAPGHVESDGTPSSLPTRHDRLPADETRPATATSRIVATGISLLAVVVVAAAFAAPAASGHAVLVAALAAVGVLAAAWLALVIARVALRPRGTTGRRISAPVTARTPWALVAGLVVGTAVGEGVVVSPVHAFSWQGYLTRLVEIHGFSAPVSLVAATIAAFVIAFAVVVVVDRAGRAGSRTADH